MFELVLFDIGNQAQVKIYSVFLKAKTGLSSRETWKEQFKPGFPRLCTVSEHLMGIGVRPETNLRKAKRPLPATF